MGNLTKAEKIKRIEDVKKYAKESYSLAELKRKLHISGGSSNAILKRIIKDNNIDISHFTGQLWNKGKSHIEEVSKIPIDSILKENVKYHSSALKQRLIKAGYKIDVCEVCGGTNQWQGFPITLELHHINGVHSDNRIENLQILCPNCHSQTNNFRNRNKVKSKGKSLSTKVENKTCKFCGKVYTPQRNSQKFCSRDCYQNFLLSQSNKSNLLSKNKLETYCNKFNTITDLAEYLQVSRPTIRKYLEKYNLLESFKGKYDFHAKPVLQYDINMNFIKEWPSISDAAETLGISAEIERVCQFKRKSCGGFIWRYK